MTWTAAGHTVTVFQTLRNPGRRTMVRLRGGAWLADYRCDTMIDPRDKAQDTTISLLCPALVPALYDKLGDELSDDELDSLADRLESAVEEEIVATLKEHRGAGA